MKIHISDKESTLLLKAWEDGFIDTDKLGALCAKMAESLCMINGMMVHPFELALIELGTQAEGGRNYED